MPRLKPSFINDIKAALEQSRFTAEDFQLDFPDSGQQLARITFAYKPEYMLVLFEEEKHDSVTIQQALTFSSRTERIRQVVYSVRTVPGRYKTRADKEIGDIGDLLKEIPDWCENIRDDLHALVPVRDPLERLRKQLQESLDRVVEDPSEFFSEDELAAVHERFDKLYKDIDELREQYSFTKQQLDTLTEEIDEFKSSARTYPKGIWAKVTSNRLVKTMGRLFDSPEGRSFLFQQAGRLLGFTDKA